MAKFVRVDMPVNSPKETLSLCVEIIERDTLLGAASPLAGFVDMAVFATKHTNANTKQKAGNKSADDAQTTYNMCSSKCGLAAGQTKDTENKVYWFVVQIRDILLLKYKGVEETLSQFGFNVVISQTGARKNVRVDMPTKPETMLELADAIIEKHTELGVASPLTAALVDMTAFETLVTEANTLLDDWKSFTEDAQTFHNQAQVILGYADGQTSETEGTIYYYLCIIRDRLLQKYQGTEEALAQWGFKVVISSKQTGPKKTEPIVIEGEVNAGATANIDLNNTGVQGDTKIKLENPGSTVLQYYFTNIINGIPVGAFVEVQPGETKTKTPIELGASQFNLFFTVRSLGVVKGLFKVTVGV